MAVIHFPCTAASAGLIMDANADHESEPAVDTKYVCQQRRSFDLVRADGLGPRGRAPAPEV
jgi:hypothetical protein